MMNNELTDSTASRTLHQLPAWMRITVLAVSISALGACSDNNASNTDTTGTTDTTTGNNPVLGSNSELTGQYAYVATRAADYGSGRIDRLSLADGNTVDGSYPATLSDMTIDTDGQHPYQIGRYQIDSVTRYDALDTSLVDYQFSVNGDDAAAANPYDIAFIDDTKAYLTRRGANSLWIINPGASSETDFKLGEIDLGAYDTDLPDMTDAIIVDNKLFVLMERLQVQPSANQIPVRSGYVAVFNTLTDTEIDTSQGAAGLKGIELLVKNPTALQYNEVTGQIYVVGRGNYFENADISDDFHSGGVEIIDPTTYLHSIVLDDGDDIDNQGYFVDLEVVDADLAYLLTYAGWGNTSLRTFSPTTGLLSDTSWAELQGVDITTIEQGPDNHLWVGINDNTPGFYRIDLATGQLAAERVATELVPMSIDFIDTTAP